MIYIVFLLPNKLCDFVFKKKREHACKTHKETKKTLKDPISEEKPHERVVEHHALQLQTRRIQGSKTPLFSSLQIQHLLRRHKTKLVFSQLFSSQENKNVIRFQIIREQSNSSFTDFASLQIMQQPFHFPLPCYPTICCQISLS